MNPAAVAQDSRVEAQPLHADHGAPDVVRGHGGAAPAADRRGRRRGRGAGGRGEGLPAAAAADGRAAVELSHPDAEVRDEADGRRTHPTGARPAFGLGGSSAWRGVPGQEIITIGNLLSIINKRAMSL